MHSDDKPINIMEEAVKFKELTTYDSNPFLNLKDKLKPKVVNIREVKAKEDKLVNITATNVVVFEGDKVQYTPRYYVQWCDGAFLRVTKADLSTKERFVLDWIMENMKVHDDEVYLHHDDIVRKYFQEDYTGKESKNFIYSALVKLAKVGIIALTEKPYMIFINPNVIFRGDVHKLYSEKYKELYDAKAHQRAVQEMADIANGELLSLSQKINKEINDFE